MSEMREHMEIILYYTNVFFVFFFLSINDSGFRLQRVGNSGLCIMSLAMLEIFSVPIYERGLSNRASPFDQGNR